MLELGLYVVIDGVVFFVFWICVGRFWLCDLFLVVFFLFPNMQRMGKKKGMKRKTTPSIVTCMAIPKMVVLRKLSVNP